MSQQGPNSQSDQLINSPMVVDVLWVLMPLVFINGSFVSVNRKQDKCF